MKKTLLSLGLLGTIIISSCKKDEPLEQAEALKKTELANFKVINKKQVVPTDINDPGTGFDDGVILGYNDAKHYLSMAGSFSTFWEIVKINGVWTVDSHGQNTFLWNGLPARNGYFEWHDIYQQSLLELIQNEPIAYYAQRYAGQKLGAQMATSETLVGGGPSPSIN